jgi:hypothetical protein
MFVTVIIALPSISEVCFKYRFIKKSRTCDLLPRTEKVENMGYLRESKDNVPSYGNNSGVQISASIYNSLLFHV